MMTLRYEEPQPISRKEVESALASENPEVAAKALIRMALWEPDWEWAEHTCLAALQNRNVEIKKAALTAIGHVARLHHVLHLEAVIPVVKQLLDDPSCQGIAEDALDDISIFVRSSNTPS